MDRLPSDAFEAERAWINGLRDLHLPEVLDNYWRRSRRVDLSLGSTPGTTPEEKLEIMKLRIDKIDRDLVAGVKLRLLREGAPRFALNILKMLCEGETCDRPKLRDAEGEQAELLKRGAPRGEELNPTMSAAVEYLTAESGLFETPEGGRIRRMRALGDHRSAGAFFVEKGSTRPIEVRPGVVEELPVLRVITDARRANALCSTESTYSMFTLDALLQTVSNVSREATRRGQRAWYAVNVDLRHWYHQLPLPKVLQHMFMLKAGRGGKWYVPRAVPMGWNQAPRLGQAASWAMVLGNLTEAEEAEFDIDCRDDEETMPAWLPFKSGVGGIFVLTDGVFVMTPDRALAERWRGRLVSRGELLHTIYKERPEVLTIEDDTTTRFDGIEFGFDWWRTVPHERAIDPHQDQLTCREVSSLLGETLWDYRVRRVSPREYAELIGLYRKFAPRSKDEWDLPASLGAADLAVLRGGVVKAREHLKRQCLEAWRPGRTALYASDACDDGTLRQCAFVRFGATEADATASGFTHSDDYIGVAELRAIVAAVEDARRREVATAEPLSMIIVATDSLVAKGWVERSYCTHEKAQPLLERLDELLEPRAVRVACPYVRSANNVADGPSRAEVRSSEDGESNPDFTGAIDPAARARTWALLKSHEQGAAFAAVVTGRRAVRRERDD